MDSPYYHSLLCTVFSFAKFLLQDAYSMALSHCMTSLGIPPVPMAHMCLHTHKQQAISTLTHAKILFMLLLSQPPDQTESPQVFPDQITEVKGEMKKKRLAISKGNKNM